MNSQFKQQRTAIPFFNSLICNYSHPQIQSLSNSKYTLYDFLFQLLVNRFYQNTNILICHLDQSPGLNQRTEIKQTIQRIFKQKLGIDKLINSYTKNNETKLMYEALKQIEIVESTSIRQPAKLNGLQKLKQYFQIYKNQNQMKEFLKNLLVEEISHQKKTIKYRKITEIQTIIQVILSSLQGEIRVDIEGENNSSIEYNFFVILLNSAQQCKKLQSILTLVRQKYPINQQTHNESTSSITLTILSRIAQKQVKALAQSYLKLVNKRKQQIQHFSSNLTLLALLKSVLKEGIRLLQQQQALKQSFLEFVKEMKQKYTKQLMNYFHGINCQLKCKSKRKQYLQTLEHSATIRSYLDTLTSVQLYQYKRKQWLYRKTTSIQNAIRAFLIRKKCQEQCRTSFFSQRQQQKSMLQQYYNKLAEYYNKTELSKLNKHNKFKYGFSCCTHILAINSQSSHPLFDPSLILTLLQRSNKHPELTTKICCSRYALQLTNIEGKTYQLGSSLQPVRLIHQSTNYNSRQNTISNEHSNCSSQQKERNISPYQTFKTSNFNSFNSTHNNTLFSFKPSVVQSQSTQCHNENYEFKIDQFGWLYGKGSNQDGQLGLGNKQFASQFTLIFMKQKIKLVSTIDKHTVVYTYSNKLFYFGRQKGILPQTNSPHQLTLNIGPIRQIKCSINDTYFLTEANKIYSLNQQIYIRIPKQISLGFDNFFLVHTGTPNLQIVYLVAFWTNSLDKAERTSIAKFLMKSQLKQESQDESMLVDSLNYQSNKQNKRNTGLHELSAILEEPEN